MIKKGCTDWEGFSCNGEDFLTRERNVPLPGKGRFLFEGKVLIPIMKISDNMHGSQNWETLP